MQNLHMPATVAKWQEMMIEIKAFACAGEGKSPYRGGRTLVQWRLKVRTGEKRIPRRGEAASVEWRGYGVICW